MDVPAGAADERAGGFGEGVLVGAETALRELPARPLVRRLGVVAKI